MSYAERALLDALTAACRFFTVVAVFYGLVWAAWPVTGPPCRAGRAPTVVTYSAVVEVPPFRPARADGGEHPGPRRRETWAR